MISRALSLVRALVRGVQRARSLGLAAELAFWLFLSLVPLAAVAGLVAARVVTGRPELLAVALDATPPAARTFVADQVARVASWHEGTVAPVAALTFVWLASSGVHAIFDALQAQTGAGRPWWVKRLLAIGGCIALSVGVALVAFAATGAGWIARVAGSHAPGIVSALESSGVGRVARGLAGAGVAVGVVSAIYWVALPPGWRGTTPVLPGAIAAVVLHTLLGYAYGLYVAKMGTGDAYLAGLAIIGVTLMTLYLFSLALLVGAELNGVLRARRTEERAAAPPTLAGPLPSPRG
jgi:membrane protein